MQAKACRGCLSMGPRLFNLFDNNLYEIFGEVLGNPIFETDSYPQLICGICYAHLMKYVEFRDRCRKVQDLLEDIELRGFKVTKYSIKKIDRQQHKLLPNLTQVTPPSLDLIIQEEITEEPAPSDDVDYEEPIPTNSLDVDDFLQNIVPYIDKSNREDTTMSPDVTEVETFAEVDPQPKCKTKLEKANSIDDPEYVEEFENKYNVNIVFLTIEQQREELEQKIVHSSKRFRPFCQDCGKSFQTEATLERHIQNMHDKSAGEGICDICKCRFPLKKLPRHLRMHKLKVSCRQCDFHCKTLGAAIHHARWHKGKVLSCKYCDLVFEKRDTMNSHILQQHQDKTQWCKCCGETFLSEFALASHLQKVHKDFMGSDHRCVKCDMKFATSEALQMHFSCEELNCLVCGVIMDSDMLLKHHVIQQHSRYTYIKLVQCTGCGVKFFGSKPLAKHLEESCGSGYPCPECGAGFSTSEELDAHKNEFHLKVYRTCDKCDKVFDARNFRLHCERVHNIKPPKAFHRGRQTSTKVWAAQGSIVSCVRAAPRPSDTKPKPFICDACGKAYASPTLLRYHARVHTGETPFKCDLCPRGFTKKDLLKAHRYMHTGEKPHKCSVCPKAFRRRQALTKHELCHSGVRRHICHMCGKDFRTSTEVKTHIKSVHLHQPVIRAPRKKRRVSKDYTDEQVLMDAQENTEITDQTQYTAEIKIPKKTRIKTVQMDKSRKSNKAGMEQSVMDDQIEYMDSDGMVQEYVIDGEIQTDDYMDGGYTQVYLDDGNKEYIIVNANSPMIKQGSNKSSAYDIQWK